MAVNLGDIPEEYLERPAHGIQAFAAMLPAPEQTLAAETPQTLSALTASDQLSSLVDMSLERLREVLSWRINMPESKLEIEQVKLQLSAIGQTLSAQLRVDDNRLKKQNTDILPKLLAELRETERRQVIVDVAARQVAAE